MSLEQCVQKLTEATNEQTKEAQAVAQRVSGMMDSLDKKADQAIGRAESNYDAKKSELTVIAKDGYRKAVETASGGRNTVIYDTQGNPNIMCVIPRFNLEDLNLPALELGTGTHPAFMTNNSPRGEILVGKYTACDAAGGTAVLGGKQPRTSVNYDAAKELCARKGDNWHMMSAHEWAAIALWSFANGTVPRGNTNYGRAHDNKLEVGIRDDGGVPGDTSGTARTDCGSGPITWAHDHTAFGVMDLVGNVWEWLDQMMLEDGQVCSTGDNDPSVVESAWIKHLAFLDSPSDAQAGNAGSPVLSPSVTKRTGPMGDDSHEHGYNRNPARGAISKASGYVKNELLRQLLIEPATAETVTGAIYSRNYGRRVPIRGGDWSNGAGAGLGALHLLNARSNAYSSLGVRPAFFV